MPITTLYTDAEDQYSRSNGSWSSTTTTLYFGEGGTDPTKEFRAWIPFANALIPRAATILKATLKVVGTATSSGVPACHARFGCENADNPVAPTTYSDLFARVFTSAVLDLSLPAYETGVEYTYDLKASVQEVVNRPGFVSGNKIAILIGRYDAGAGYRGIAAVENTTYPEAILEIEYSVSGGNSVAITPYMMF